jgi:hypothetical protein
VLELGRGLQAMSLTSNLVAAPRDSKRLRPDEHVPQLKKRDTTIVAIPDVFNFRLIGDDGHFCKFYQPMRFDVIHPTSSQRSRQFLRPTMRVDAVEQS